MSGMFEYRIIVVNSDGQHRAINFRTDDPIVLANQVEQLRAANRSAGSEDFIYAERRAVLDQWERMR
jgi:hypothetical protein